MGANGKLVSRELHSPAWGIAREVNFSYSGFLGSSAWGPWELPGVGLDSVWQAFFCSSVRVRKLAHRCSLQSHSGWRPELH